MKSPSFRPWLVILLALGRVVSGYGNDHPVSGEPWTNSLGMRFLSVPTCSDTTAPPRWLGKNLVTRDIYELVMGTDPSQHQGGPNHPVDSVSFHDAEDFCRRLSQAETRSGLLPPGYAYAIPDSQLWQTACRAGDLEPFGDELLEYAWFFESCLKEPADEGDDIGPRPVGTRRPNAWGFHDILGNVWEWCIDEGNEWPTIHGGSYASGPRDVRSTVRYRRSPDYRGRTQGFRVALIRQSGGAEHTRTTISPSERSSVDSSNQTLELQQETEAARPDERLESGRSVQDSAGRVMTDDTGLRFVFVPPGSMRMLPIWRTLRDGEVLVEEEIVFEQGFWLSVTEVTQEQWYRVMRTRPSVHRGQNRPVDNVSWDEAMEFCIRLTEMYDGTYRLPSEAEWEYAARGAGTGVRLPDLRDVGWSERDRGRSTRPVAQRRPGPLGLYDMLGNVAEWCGDIIGALPGYIRIDGGEKRVLRGGCFTSPPDECTPMSRIVVSPDQRQPTWGFRILRLVEQDETD